MWKRTSWLMAAVLAAGLTVVTLSARAQPPPTPAPPPPLPPIVQPVARQLTLEELGSMLDMLGYSPKPYNNKDGKLAGYDLEFPFADWTMRMSVSLSFNKTNIWVNTNIQTLTDLAAVRVEGLLKLLAENNKVWPAYVYYTEGTRPALRLALPIPNSNVTAAVLRTKINDFSNNIKRLIILWKSFQTAPAPLPLPTPPLPG